MYYRAVHILTLILLVCLQGSLAHATLGIPAGMTDGEQELVLQILGFGTAFRPVDNPYPLGGYNGLELGVSLESLPTADIGYLGTQSSVDRNTVYPLFSMGKGIRENIDLFFSFMPYNQNTGIGVYSGALRWTFFQATFVPASFSILASGTNTNVNNLVISQTEGVDVISGVNVEPFSFYLGAGTLYGQSQFDSSVTAEGTKTNQNGRSFHTLIGVNFAINELFSALEIDTYSTTTISLKLGTRL